MWSVTRPHCISVPLLLWNSKGTLQKAQVHVKHPRISEQNLRSHSSTCFHQTGDTFYFGKGETSLPTDLPKTTGMYSWWFGNPSPVFFLTLSHVLIGFHHSIPFKARISTIKTRIFFRANPGEMAFQRGSLILLLPCSELFRWGWNESFISRDTSLMVQKSQGQPPFWMYKNP